MSLGAPTAPLGGFTGYWDTAAAQARIIAVTRGTILRVVNRPNGILILSGQCIATDVQVTQRSADLLRTAGSAEAARWPGCYSVVLITADGVTLWAEPVGQFPVYITETAAGVWFGTGARDIAHRVRAQLDTVSLAATMVCPEARELFGDRSMFRGVRQVPEGHVVTVDPFGIREHSPAELRVDPLSTLSAAGARLRLCLSEAITARAAISRRPTSDFSGGLDSTSLAFLAVRDIRVPLPVLTSVDPGMPMHDDCTRAGEYARGVDRMRQHLVATTPEYLPYQEFGPTGDAPHGSVVAVGAIRARLVLAAQLGSDLHLTGEGGDLMAGAPPACLADLARRGDIARLWRHCVAWARLRNRSPLAVLRRAVALAGTSRAAALRSLAIALERGRPGAAASWEQDMVWYWTSPQVHWLTAPARHELAAHVRQVAERLPDHPAGVGDGVGLGWLRLQAATMRTVRAIGAELGVDVHAPFLDTDVARTCLGLPAHRRADPTVPKPLLRAALTGLVPDAVLARRTKGDYTRDAHLGVRRAATVLRRLLADSVAADHGIIEPGPIRRALDDAINGLPTPWGALNQALALEVWSRDQVKAGLPTC
jgi:asparagine synthase (glutamine-hydrolysing)